MSLSLDIAVMDDGRVQLKVWAGPAETSRSTMLMENHGCVTLWPVWGAKKQNWAFIVIVQTEATTSLWFMPQALEFDLLPPEGAKSFSKVGEEQWKEKAESSFTHFEKGKTLKESDWWGKWERYLLCGSEARRNVFSKKSREPDNIEENLLDTCVWLNSWNWTGQIPLFCGTTNTR